MEEKAHCVQMQYHTLILEYRKASKEFDKLVDMIDGSNSTVSALLHAEGGGGLIKTYKIKR